MCGEAHGVDSDDERSEQPRARPKVEPEGGCCKAAEGDAREPPPASCFTTACTHTSRPPDGPGGVSSRHLTHASSCAMRAAAALAASRAAALSASRSNTTRANSASSSARRASVGLPVASAGAGRGVGACPRGCSCCCGACGLCSCHANSSPAPKDTVNASACPVDASLVTSDMAAEEKAAPGCPTDLSDTCSGCDVGWSCSGAYATGAAAKYWTSTRSLSAMRE
eukprot:scaffold271098_cov27-Tisochrysis_lutea.AAC.3